jgi:hypothetical protein
MKAIIDGTLVREIMGRRLRTGTFLSAAHCVIRFRFEKFASAFRFNPEARQIREPHTHVARTVVEQLAAVGNELAITAPVNSFPVLHQLFHSIDRAFSHGAHNRTGRRRMSIGGLAELHIQLQVPFEVLGILVWYFACLLLATEDPDTKPKFS